MQQITMSVLELQELLEEQKRLVGAYITRNLTTYHWYNNHPNIDIDKAKNEMKAEAVKAGFPNDFVVLKKYLKD